MRIISLSIPSTTASIIAILCSFLLVLIAILGLVLCICILHRRRATQRALNTKNLIYSSPGSISSNRSIFPPIRLSAPPNMDFELCKITTNEARLGSPFPAHYRTFDLTKRHCEDPSSETSSIQSDRDPSASILVNSNQSKSTLSLPRSSNSTIQTVFEHHSCESDLELESTSIHEAASCSLEYSLLELFRIELVYRLAYSKTDHQLLFQVVRLTPTQPLIEQYFSSLFCHIRLFVGHDHTPTKKVFSNKNPVDELFRFKLDQSDFDKSYLKLQILGQHDNCKRLELGQTVIVLGQIEYLETLSSFNSQTHTKFIQIYEDRIGLINRYQTMNRDVTRALICLVYESDRCLLHVGVIKILALQYLLQECVHHVHRHDQIQIKISTLVDGRVLLKKKSKLIPMGRSTYTYNTSFTIDYLSLHKMVIRLMVCYRRSLISPQSKPISVLEFGSTQVKNQQTFQHWTDALTGTNRPHVQWHVLEPMMKSNDDK